MHIGNQRKGERAPCTKAPAITSETSKSPTKNMNIRECFGSMARNNYLYDDYVVWSSFRLEKVASKQFSYRNSSCLLCGNTQ